MFFELCSPSQLRQRFAMEWTPDSAISLPHGVGLATATVYPHGVILSTFLNSLSLVVAVRYIVVLVAGFIAGNHTADAVRAWREWHSWAGQDPSGAEAYRTFFLVSTSVAVLSLSIAGLVWWLLRPRTGSQGAGLG